jgi:hypothetical protein
MFAGVLATRGSSVTDNISINAEVGDSGVVGVIAQQVHIEKQYIGVAEPSAS